MHQSRRQFIYHSSMGALSFFGTPYLSAGDGGGFFVLAEGQSMRFSTQKGPDSPYARMQPPVFEGVRIFGNDKAFRREVGTPPAGLHGMVYSSKYRKLFSFEKWGPHAVIIDLISGQAKPLQPLKNCEFYGHGCSNGEHVYASESDLKTGEARISVRRASDGSIVKHWSYSGVGLHDLAYNGRVIIAPFSGRKMAWKPEPLGASTILERMERTYLAVINPISGAVIQEIESPDQDLSLTHIWNDPFAKEVFYIGTTPRKLANYAVNGLKTEDVHLATALSPMRLDLTQPGGILQKGVVPVEIQKEIRIEILNAATTSAYVIFSAPFARKLVVFDRKTFAFVKALDCPNACGGLASIPSTDEVLVSGLNERKALLLSAKLEFGEQSFEIGRGSHLYYFSS